MFDVLVECRACGVVGTGEDGLCHPESLKDTCLDHSTRESRLASPPCDPVATASGYTCAVCGRPALQALRVCYPRRRGGEAEPAG